MSQAEHTTLGQSCEFFNGKAHEKAIDDKGKFIVVNSKFVSTEGKTFKRTNEQLFPLYTGDIVMVMSDVPNGKTLAKCFVIDKDDTYSLNQRICCIRSKDFDTKYLYYQLNRHPHLLAFNNGENQSNLRKDDILACPLMKPSLEEQRRMVEQLDQTFAKLNQAKANTLQNIKNAKELFETELRNIFENKGDDWEEKTLRDVCEFKSGTTINANLEKSRGEVIYAKVGDMNLKGNEHFINLSSRYVDFDCIKINQIIPPGSIIFPKRGGAIATNKKRKIVKPTIVDLNTMALVPHSNIDSDFLFHWFEQIDLNELSNGTSIPQINNYSFDNVIISFPISLKTQQEIVAKLDALKTQTQTLEASYQAKLNNLEELYSGILKRAFEPQLIEA